MSTSKASFKKEHIGYKLSDCLGLCYPTTPGSTVDILFGLSVLERGERYRKQLKTEVAGMKSEEIHLVQSIIDILDSLPIDSLVRLFSTPLAEIDTNPSAALNALDHTGGTKGVLFGVRHLIHHPDVCNVTFILPTSLFTKGPLYLPHIHALLFNGEPNVTLAVAEEVGITRFVWSDGLSLSLVNDGSKLPEGFHHPRIKPLPYIGSFPVLNAVTEIKPLLNNFDPAIDEEIESGVEPLKEALTLLSQVWPLAFHALQRHVKALCILKNRHYSRSHSPPELPGTIIMSIDDAVCISDLLCHESSHLRMNIFRLYDSIANARNLEMETTGFVSPWRPDLRPLHGLLDGVHAFLNVCYFYRRLEDIFPGAWNSSVIYERQRLNVIKANMTLRQQAIPTAVGAILLEEFNREVALL